MNKITLFYIYIYYNNETNVRLILTCLYNVNMTIPVDTWSQWLPIVTLMFKIKQLKISSCMEAYVAYICNIGPTI